MVVPRGRPKSGRVWRDPGYRSKSIIVSSRPKTSWKKRKIERSETRVIRELEREMKDAVQKERDEKKKKMAEKRQRKIENEKKSEIIQKITNVSKLKRLKKRQLKTIEKR